MKKRSNLIYIHALIGLASIPGYLFGGIIFKIFIIPYVVWMVNKRSSIFFPALCIHLVTETMIMYVIYTTAAYVCIKNFHEISKYRVRGLFIALLLITILIFGFWVTLYYKYDIPFNDSVVRLNLFIPLYSFFYGLLISKDINKEVVNSVFGVLLILFILHVTNMVKGRVFFFEIPLWCSASALWFLTRKGRRKNRLVLWISLLFLVWYFASIGNSTFTIFLSVALSVIFSLIYFKKHTAFFARYFGIMACTFIGGLMTWGIMSYKTQDITGPVDDKNINLTSEKAFISRLEFKIFEDRAPYWAGGFEQIVTELNWLPPVEVNSVTGTYKDQSEFETAFGAHNLYLDVVRTNGIISGVVIIFLFVSFMIMSIRLFTVQHIHPRLVVLISTTASVLLMGSIAGTFPILPPFGLLSLGLAGVGYGISRNPAKTITGVPLKPA